MSLLAKIKGLLCKWLCQSKRKANFQVSALSEDEKRIALLGLKMAAPDGRELWEQNDSIEGFIDALDKHLEAERVKLQRTWDATKDMEFPSNGALEMYEDSLIEEGGYLKELRFLGDELAILALHKRSELTLGRYLQLSRLIGKKQLRKIYNFEQSKVILKKLGIYISKCQGYDYWQELQETANSIKHSGKVNEKLSNCNVGHHRNQKDKPLHDLNSSYKSIRPMVEKMLEDVRLKLIALIK